MKKILVTGSNFEGSVEVLYGASSDGAPLLAIDMRGAVLTDVQKEYFKGCVPVRYGAGYEQNWGPMTGKVQIVTEDHDLDFVEDFWKPYDKKINKDRALKEWKSMVREDKALAVHRLSAYMRYLSRSSVAKADPENYLRKKYYKNDYDNL